MAVFHVLLLSPNEGNVPFLSWHHPREITSATNWLLREAMLFHLWWMSHDGCVAHLVKYQLSDQQIKVVRMYCQCQRWLSSLYCCYRVHLQAVCFQSFVSNVISWVQSLQPPRAWTVGSCWQYVTSFGICHKGTCRLLQGPTFWCQLAQIVLEIRPLNGLVCSHWTSIYPVEDDNIAQNDDVCSPRR